MADVFISHSSKDKEIADRLCEYLERNGLKCWIAPRNIEPGCEWPVAISEAIQNVKIMVVIYSHNAASSTQVPKELTLADKRKKRIIPYKIDDADLEGSFDYFLSSAHWIMEDKANPDASFAELRKVICNSIGFIMPQELEKASHISEDIIHQTVITQPVSSKEVKTVSGPVKNKTKKKKAWLLPVCIGGGVVALGLFLFFVIGIALIGVGLSSSSGTNNMNASSDKVSPASDFQYLVDPEGVVITKYIGTEEEVVVPSEISGTSVVEISNNAFANNTEIKTVYLPNSILFIEYGAFCNSSVEKVFLPKNLTRICSYVFYGCKNLKQITFPNTIERIEPYAFGESGLEELVLPNSVQHIMEFSFYNCTKLKSITFSENLKSIGTGAFAFTAVAEVSLPDSIRHLSAEVFMECDELVSIKFPRDITFIPSHFLYSCSKLKDVTFPSGLLKINYYAFGFTALEKVDLSNTPLISIEYGAFESCINLNEVIFPNSLIVIEDRAFRACTSLSDVYLPERFQYLYSTAFELSDKIKVYFEDKEFLYDELSGLSVKMNEKLASKFTSTLTDDGLRIDSYIGTDMCVVVPETINGVSVTSLGSNTFFSNKELLFISLPYTLHTIEANAFMYCSNLQMVSGGESVTTVGDSAFAVSGLIEPFLPLGVTIIPMNMFYGCNNLTNIYVHKYVTAVYPMAFAYCESLDTISFTETTKEISRDAFTESFAVNVYVPYYSYSYEQLELIPNLVDYQGY